MAFSPCRANAGFPAAAAALESRHSGSYHEPIEMNRDIGHRVQVSVGVAIWPQLAGIFGLTRVSRGLLEIGLGLSFEKLQTLLLYTKLAKKR
jgi:hypothetical protein